MTPFSSDYFLVLTVIWLFDLLLNQEAGPECCKDKLKARKDILRKYLDNNIALELEALFTLQEIYVKYNKPAGKLLWRIIVLWKEFTLDALSNLSSFKHFYVNISIQ